MQLLNNLTPAQFLAEYWQKKPLLIRGAIPNFKGLLTPNELAGLACEDDVQARIIQQKKAGWKVQHSPIDEADFAKLPKQNWTLLVQSVNHFLPEAADLLALFDFIPHARLDDLMVSYAPTGGGVGAHVDSYDVFLLQGSGKRNWKISAQTDLSLVENAPLKILKNFIPEQEFTLEAGDMLYLPPQIAHWGVSESDDCMTYSIGFRAPSYQELAHEFLHYLQDHVQLAGMVSDPDLTVQKHAGEISDALQALVYKAFSGLTWTSDDIGDFLGHYLSEPKAHIYFDAPAKISLAAFTQKLANKSLALNLKSQLLFTKNAFYLNGEKLIVPTQLYDCMRELADKRRVNTHALEAALHKPLGHVLYDAYLAGFVNIR